MKYLICSIWVCFFLGNMTAQGLPNDCVNFVQVCGNYDINLDVSGAGVQEIGPNACNSNENNSLWLRFTVESSGTLGFTLAPESSSIQEDYDFWVFGPDVSCDNLGTAIRCSTTNPAGAGQANNHTGLNETSTDFTEGPGPNGDSFLQWLDVEAGEEYFLVIDRPIGNSAFDLTWTGTAVLENPLLNYTLNEIDDIHLCDNDNDGIESYDFSIWDEDLVSPMTEIEVTYHQNESDAFSGNNALNFPDDVYEGLYYARIAHINSRCFDIIPVRIFLDGIFQDHTISYLEDIVLCDNDNDGEITYDFSIWNNDIVDDSNNLEITYHTSNDNAVDNINALGYPDEIQEGTYYIRITDALSSCFTVLSVNVIVGDLLEQYDIHPLDDIYICDMDNNGFESYDLSLWNEDIISDSDGFDIAYFATENDAANDVNPLSFPNNISSGMYFVRMWHVDSQCMSILPVDITVENPLSSYSINPIDDIYICDNDLNGTELFDFSSLNEEIVDNLGNLEISYYNAQSDADNAQNELNYPDEIGTGTYFVRIMHNVTGCYMTLPVEINLDNISAHYDIHDLEPIYVCDEDNDGIVNYDFSIWDNDLINITNDIQITYHTSLSDADEAINPLNYPDQIQEGEYYARIMQLATSCYKVVPITIDMSSLQIVSLEIIDENQIIAHTNFQYLDGVEYSLDGGDWQSSNQFFDVGNGLHSVQMRYDQCLSDPMNTYILMVTNVITPNGDGLNDVWSFPGLDEYAGSQIIIYDRYGKEILRMSGDKPFQWDGTYLGRSLPSASYWYKILLPDGREQKGHITILNQ